MEAIGSGKLAVSGRRIARRAESTAPLALAQQRLWYLEHANPGTPTYNIPVGYRIAGRLDAAALATSLRQLIHRHGALRTRFSAEDGVPVQIVEEAGPTHFESMSVEHLPAAEREAEAMRLARALVQMPFAIQEGQLLRARLIRLSFADHILAISIHHIACDGWSVAILAKELETIYAAAAARRPIVLPEAPIRFSDFAFWQHEQNASEAWDSQIEYWRKQLEGAPERLHLLTDRARPERQGSRGGKAFRNLPAGLASELKAMATGHDATLFMVLLAGFDALLYRMSGQTDFVVGSPAAGRAEAETDELVGFFVNMLPLRAAVADGMTFNELLLQVRQTTIEAVANADVPIDRVIEHLALARNPAYSPLFQAAFGYMSAPLDPPRFGEARSSLIQLDTATAKFDLTMEIIEDRSELICSLEYNADLFDYQSAARYLASYEELLRAAVRDTRRRISCVRVSEAIDLSTAAQFSGATSDYPRNFSLTELFEAAVETWPDRVAVLQGRTWLTYAELNRRANQIARLLASRSVSRGDFVAIGLERSPWMIAGILGSLKAGAAYVPLDPAYPVERLRFMLADVGAKCLLADSRFERVLEFGGVETMSLDNPALLVDFSDKNPADVPARAEDVAYLMYTSGTTGKPKGVVVPHRAVVRLVCGTNFMHFGPEEVFLQLAPVSFDASTLEIWGPLLHGGRLVLARPGASSLAEIGRAFRDNGITTVFLTTALFQLMIEQQTADLRGIKQLLTGGEVLNPAHVRRALDELPDTLLINAYGPTENTTFSSCHQVSRADLARPSIPIGRPIANTFVYILDEALEPVGVGMPGALWTGGDGVALGYWNRPELTAERFLPDPFRAGGTMYATGDRARWLADGTLEFLGRGDEQVKIRGFRIEPGEIEAALQEHPAVSQAVVLARETPHGTGKRLLAWVALRSGARVSGPQLREYLQGRLPEYLVPAACVVLDALPLSANGKVDRAALPEPEMASDLHPAESRKLPREASGVRAEIERKLAAIWQRALHVESIPRQANFFEIGGHSLLLIKVHAELERELAGELAGREVKIVDLFRYPTLRALAGFLAGSAESQTEPAYEADEEGQRAHSGWEPMAIIAMTGRFPGAPSVEQLWEKLRAGEEMIRPFSEEELRSAGVPEAEYSAAHYVKAGTVLENCESFDARYFGFNPREAEITDPQHRVFLECAHEALERAGYDPARYRGRIGVFAGSTMSSYWTEKLMRNRQALENVGYLQTLIGNDKDFVPTRVAYKLNLRGPAVNVQTACSTSLVAVHMACESLAAGTCDMALAGGVSIRFPQPAGYLYQAESIMSPDGHCRPFDEQAAGTVAGNGAGIVLLKRLADAERDGDRIEAVILGSAINNDGSNKVGYTAPGVDGQAAVIRAALERAGIAPDSVTAIEAHGTGTKLGDPIEVAALKAVFGEQANEFGPRCALASAKGNLGHLDAAAGVTGLIKATLQLQHGELVGMPHSGQPNPALGLAQSRFYLPTGVVAWERKGGRRRIGVSSFGIGGTNAHVVLEEAPVRDDEQNRPARDYELLALSAKTETALNRLTLDLADYLERHPAVNLADVAYTLAVGRAQHPWRRTVVCQSTAQAIQALRTLDPETVRSGLASETSRPLVFMFPGQGSQRAQMGKGLYGAERAFREAFDHCAEVLKPLLGSDIRETIFNPNPVNTEALNETAIAQSAIFVVEYSLAQMLINWGIKPLAMIGHSIGEYVAACLAGVLSLEDALKVVASRGALMQSMPRGAMLALRCTAEQALEIAESRASLAAINGQSDVVLSGAESTIEEIESRAAAAGIETRRLRTSHAYHSELMDGAVEAMKNAAAAVHLETPSIRYVSNVTGRWITAHEATDPAYWGAHLRHTVNFAKGLSTLLAERSDTFVEIGPGSSLTGLLRRREESRSGGVISLAAMPGLAADEAKSLYDSIGRLWIAGLLPDWNAFHADRGRRRLKLPTYPFERERFMAEADFDQRSRGAHRRQPIDDWFYVPTWERMVPRDGATGKDPATTVLIADESVLESRFAKLLDPAAMAIPGDEFRRRRDGRYEIRKDSTADHIRFFQAIQQEGIRPERVIHAWGLQTQSAEDNYFSLVPLMQALGETRLSEDTEVTVLAAGTCAVVDSDVLNPSSAMIRAAAGVIAREYPASHCRFIDVEPNAWNAANRRALERLLSALAADEEWMAIRGSQLWRPVYRRVALDPRPLRMRANPVVLITGGHGNAGLDLGGYLARTYGARVVLLSRSGPSANALERIRQIGSSGGEVLSVAADVADLHELGSAIEEAELHFGAITAVIHAAGEAGGGLIEHQTRERIAKTLTPKVCGTKNLIGIFEGHSLDFFVIYSSQRSVVPAPGRIDYCAANAYLDAFALTQETRPVLSISWDSWREGGMGDPSAGAFSTKLAEAMSGEEAIECFERAVAGGFAHVIVSTRDFDQVISDSRSISAAVIAEELGKVRQERHARVDSRVAYAPPRNSAEVTLCEIWQDILGIERVGVEDNFFDLGGDSVVSIQMIGRAAQRGIRLSSKQIFEQQTIAKLAVPGEAKIESTAEQGLVTGPAPLTPIQAWFFEQPFADAAHFNQAVMLETSVDPGIIEAGIRDLCEHHDALRLQFPGEGGILAAEYARTPGAGVVQHIDLADVPDDKLEPRMAALADQTQQSLNIQCGPIIRAVLFGCGLSRPTRLLIAIHHVAVDLTSWQILLEDLETACSQLVNGQAVCLGRKTTSYRDWAKQLKRRAEAGEFRDEISYWTSISRHGAFALPRDRGDSRMATAADADRIVREVEGVDPQALRSMAVLTAVQPDHVLLATLGKALGEWAGAQNVVVDVESFGRDPLFPETDVSRTAGWFTAIHPFALAGLGPAPMTSRIERVKRDFDLMPRGGVGYGALRYLDPQWRRLMKPDRGSQVCFLYSGEWDAAAHGRLFQAASESCGRLCAPSTPMRYEISIEAGIQRGRLQLSFVYNSRAFDRSTIERLARLFEESVRNVFNRMSDPGSEASRTGAAEFGWDDSDVDELKAAVARGAGL